MCVCSFTGCVVKHWSPLLATSKAQYLLLRIIDVLLLPHSLLQDKTPPPQLISAIRETLPLYLQVCVYYTGVFVCVCSGFLCVLIILFSTVYKHVCFVPQGLSVAVGVSQTQVSYLKQQLRNVITQYLSRFFPATPSIGAIANHPVLLAGCEATPTPQGAALRRTILHVIR